MKSLFAFSFLLLFLSPAVLAEETPSPEAVAEDKASNELKKTMKGREMPAFPSSLMFTSQETEELDKMLLELERKLSGSAASPEMKPIPPEPRPNIYLSALVYSSSSDWSAWINGIRFRPGTVQGGIRPVKATARWIELDVDTNEGPTVRVRLAPNQTYLSKDDRVVDGIFQ